MRIPLAPFDSARYIGTVCQVDPTTIRVNLPRAASAFSGHHAGHVMPAGQVGELVLIESEAHAIVGRIIEVRLPERERLSIQPKQLEIPTYSKESGNEANPVGVVQLLTSLELTSGKTIRGIAAHPRIAQHVFSAHPLLIKHIVEQGSESDQIVELAFLPHSLDIKVVLTSKALFGRHCAVLGTTGGGKSWTVARLLEQIVHLNGKAILFDATGEFHSLNQRVRHVYLGGNSVGREDRREFVTYPFHLLSESDIFVLFNPRGASQAPKLREALRSLKLANICPDLAPDGYITKTQQPKKPIEDALKEYAEQLEADDVLYDIKCLPRQLQEECVQIAANFGKDPTRWGDPSNELAYCTTLIGRMETTIKSPFMACIFKPDKRLRSLPKAIEEFLESTDRVLRISMEDLSFEHHTREVITDVIGRYLLKLARKGAFKKNRTVVALDEAHQFLNKSLGDDEYSRIPLESFGLIAKEGRKYGLTVILSTQRPRDIPTDVLSQMGMFIVHRLISEKDRQAVEQACGSIDEAAAGFLPTLGEGEAIIVGIDAPMPLPVKILPPEAELQSDGLQGGKFWNT